MYSTSLLVGRFERLFGRLGSLSGFLQVIFLDEESLRSAPNSLKRKFCYHAVGTACFLTNTLRLTHFFVCTVWGEGNLGPGLRVPIPGYPMGSIRFQYPKGTEQEYMGHEENKFL